MMTLQQAWRQGTQLLTQAAVEGAQLDAQVLLSSVVGMDRAHVLAYPEKELTAAQEQRYMALLQRRSVHEPVAYIMGQREFYGRDFLVNPYVLIPRPETELLVEAALAAIRARLSAGTIPVVADIGTGSGAIPVTIALEEPALPFIYACDISADALAVTQHNCEQQHVADRVRLLQGDLLAPLPEAVDVLLANLPYVGEEEMAGMSQDVLAYEPHLALFSGPLGLDLLSRLCKEAHTSGTLKSGGVMLLEIGYQQGEQLTRLLHELWPQSVVLCHKDYAGWDRLLQVSL